MKYRKLPYPNVRLEKEVCFVSYVLDYKHSCQLHSQVPAVVAIKHLILLQEEKEQPLVSTLFVMKLHWVFRHAEYQDLSLEEAIDLLQQVKTSVPLLTK